MACPADDIHVRVAKPVGGIADRLHAALVEGGRVELADDLRRVTKPAGTLLISGILADDHDHVLAALRPLRPVTTVTSDGWAAVQLRW